MSQETAKVKKVSIGELAAFRVFVFITLIIVAGALSSREWGFAILLEIQIIVLGIVVFWIKQN